MSSTTALVPFKLNSERVPNKNFRLLNDKPLYWWVLESLIYSKCVDRIIINTDAKAMIESLGLPAGVEIVIKDRKDELCGDLVSMNSIIRDDLNHFEASSYLMTHTTNPFVQPSTFSRAVAQYKTGIEHGEIDSLFSVNKLHARLYTEDLKPINHDPSNLIRTQDLAPIYEENSCFYIFSRNSFSSNEARIGVRPGVAITQGIESIDIDTEGDWSHAELIACGLKQR
jgi:CMP-N-acetylneuraminic acid synthetase